MSEWIRCTTRLPKNQEECLIAFLIIPGDEDCGYCYSLATYINGEFWSWELEKNVTNCTHWMPLPEIPN